MVERIQTDIAFAMDQLQEIRKYPSAFHVHSRVTRVMEALERIEEATKQIEERVLRMEQSTTADAETMLAELQEEFARQAKESMIQLPTPH